MKIRLTSIGLWVFFIILAQYSYSQLTYVFSLKSCFFTLKADQTGSENYRISISFRDKSQAFNYDLHSSIDLFKTNFIRSIKSITSQNTVDFPVQDSLLSAQCGLILNFLYTENDVSKRNFATESTLKVNYLVPVRCGNGTDTMKIQFLKLEFEQGFLKTIHISGTIKSSIQNLTNRKCIPFQYLSDYERLKDYFLIDDSRKYTVKCNELFSFLPSLKMNLEDYCPSDQSYQFTITPGNNSSSFILFMTERNRNALEAGLFSDLVGLNPNEPNGLVQFEISSKFQVTRHQLNKNLHPKYYFSFFHYCNPKFTYSKLEQNNKYYFINSSDSTTGKGVIPTLEIYKYSIANLKLLLNAIIFKWGNSVKSGIEINGGFTTLYTTVLDSLTGKNTTEEIGMTSGFPFFELKYLMEPSDKFSFECICDLGWLFLWNEKITQVNETGNYNPYQSINRKIFSVQMNAQYSPFPKGRSSIFTRISYSTTLPLNDNFIQIQFGYFFKLF
jgi:hypothetical protein